jgi:hypothetical protein
VKDGEVITIGIDGARFDDALAVIATEVVTGYQWPLGVWERPKNADADYEHPMDEVDGVLIDAFTRWHVWRVYADPGSTTSNILPWIENWQGKFGDKKIIEWLMTRPKPTAYMIRHFASAIAGGDVSHDGNPVVADHISNARRKETNVLDEDARIMHVISKESPHSDKKIDAAAASALSWEARGDAVAEGYADIVGYEDPRIMCKRCGHLKRHHLPACRARPEGHCDGYVER